MSDPHEHDPIDISVLSFDPAIKTLSHMVLAYSSRTGRTCPSSIVLWQVQNLLDYTDYPPHKRLRDMPNSFIYDLADFLLSEIFNEAFLRRCRVKHVVLEHQHAQGKVQILAQCLLAGFRRLVGTVLISASFMSAQVKYSVTHDDYAARKVASIQNAQRLCRENGFPRLVWSPQRPKLDDYADSLLLAWHFVQTKKYATLSRESALWIARALCDQGFSPFRWGHDRDASQAWNSSSSSSSSSSSLSRSGTSLSGGPVGRGKKERTGMASIGNGGGGGCGAGAEDEEEEADEEDEGEEEDEEVIVLDGPPGDERDGPSTSRGKEMA